MVLELKNQLIYGPVRSRRLKWSLGINLLPFDSKVCTFDCLYCQYGLNHPVSNGEAQVQRFPSVAEVLDAVEEAVQTITPPPLYLTFSGNGEPTLHPDFKQIVAGVNDIRDRRSTVSKTSVLSNSTTLASPAVRQALGQLDEPILKLDAGTEDMFKRYNGSANGIDFNQTVQHLASLPNVTIQTLFSKGTGGNADPEHLDQWLLRIKRISPRFVQLYTLSRPSPTRSLLPLDREKLMEIRTMLDKEGISAEVYG